MRVLLGGKGSPIPNIALPDPNLDENLPTQVLELKDGDTFRKADWVGLGYTDFEVWCVGGAGGRGGDSGEDITWHTRISTSYPNPPVYTFTVAEWAIILDQVGPGSTFQIVHYGRPTGNAGRPLGRYISESYSGRSIWELSGSEYVEHLAPNRTYHPIFLSKPHPSKVSLFGGGGGGGGAHVVSGSLEDIPDEVPVVVGAAGIDAPVGQHRENASIVGYPPVPFERYWGYMRYRTPPHEVDPDPMTYWPAPTVGQDGGLSSFNGSMCQASGGKGGGPAMYWSGAQRIVHGRGGDGGLGGRATPGGGGLGSNVNGPGLDGSWDGTIGGGGGGGRGGAEVGSENGYSGYWYNGAAPGSFWREGELQYINRILTGPNKEAFLKPDALWKSEFYRPATNGGRGGFSFSDTSIYGSRQLANFLENQSPEYMLYIVTYDGHNEYKLNYLAQPVIPGGGGGVKVLRKLKYGSDAPSYSQNGAVVLRLIKRD